MTTTIVVGGGTAGACIAGRLTEAGDDVLLLEAGPDYGPLGSGRWPEALLNAHALGTGTHDWDYRSGCSRGEPDLELERAKVIGGCSSHNGCAVVWGPGASYDAWADLGLTSWNAAALEPFFQMATERLHTHIPPIAGAAPFQQASLAAALALGYGQTPTLASFDATSGFSMAPVNSSDGIRWNTALAYLDPVRNAPNLRVLGDLLVDRVIVHGTTVVGVEAIGPDGPVRFEADRVVLCAGAYGTPPILQRSGIGDADESKVLGIAPVHHLPGVGKNLRDHPSIKLEFAGTEKARAVLAEFEAAGGRPSEEGVIGLAASSRCEEAFDLHIYPVSLAADGEWTYHLPAAVVAPRSTGFVTITGLDPAAPPLIDHGYLTDPEGYDLDALMDAIGLMRELAAAEPLASLIGPELPPSAGLTDRAALAGLLPTVSKHYYHPAGSCAMGLASDPMAVVDELGAVHGLSGLFIVDASIFPVIPRANTNLPVLALAEAMAGPGGRWHTFPS
jgi:choline dehydrogenase